MMTLAEQETKEQERITTKPITKITEMKKMMTTTTKMTIKTVSKKMVNEKNKENTTPKSAKMLNDPILKITTQTERKIWGFENDTVVFVTENGEKIIRGVTKINETPFLN